MEWSRLLLCDIICSKWITIHFQWGGNMFLVTLNVPGDLDIQTRPNEWPNMSSQICSAVPEIFDSQTKKQAGWFLRPDCAPRSECPQFGMPAERHAQFHVANVPRSRISECAPFRIYEHAQCRVMSCQRRHAVPLQPIWTIMVAAKLGQSRVLVTKFFVKIG